MMVLTTMLQGLEVIQVTEKILQQMFNRLNSLL